MLQDFSLKIDDMVMVDAKQNLKLFEDLEDLVDNLSKVVSSNVEFHNVKKLFGYFSSLLIAALLVFLANDFLSIRRQAISRKLVRLINGRSARIRPMTPV